MHGNPAFFNVCLLFFCTFYGNYLKYNACKTFSILLK